MVGVGFAFINFLLHIHHLRSAARLSPILVPIPHKSTNKNMSKNNDYSSTRYYSLFQINNDHSSGFPKSLAGGECGRLHCGFGDSINSQLTMVKQFPGAVFPVF
jgi:hypothetical protein